MNPTKKNEEPKNETCRCFFVVNNYFSRWNLIIEIIAAMLNKNIKKNKPIKNTSFYTGAQRAHIDCSTKTELPVCKYNKWSQIL